MRPSGILSVYIGRHFLAALGSVLLMLLGLILLFDVIELLRRSVGRPNAGFDVVLEMALLRLPHMGLEILPFAVLFAGMLCFWRLTRSSELVVARAVGLSIWQLLLPAIVIGILLGGLAVTAINPLSSTLLARWERMEAQYLRGQASEMSLSPAGLWLRQVGPEGVAILHAPRVQLDGELLLSKVTVLRFGPDGEFTGRIDAETARLKPGYWQIAKAWVAEPEQRSQLFEQYRLPTDLTLDRVQNSFAPPDTLSFWALPRFIATLEAAGFSAVRHRLHLHSLLATPLLVCAMVLLAATFSLRPPRRGGTTLLVGGGALTGFLLYAFSRIIAEFGELATIPVMLAAWAPAGIGFLLGVAALLHLEDG